MAITCYTYMRALFFNPAVIVNSIISNHYNRVKNKSEKVMSLLMS